jgi:hypothetical protein
MHRSWGWGFLHLTLESGSDFTPYKITYSKGFRDRFSWNFFIHMIYPSIRLVIHPWMASYREENPAEINNAPLCVCVTVEERHARGGGHPQDFDIIISNKPNISAVCCYLTGHKQCKHQDFQRPGSPWIHVECGI